MLSLVTLPATAIASTTEYITSFATDLWGIIALAIGIPLAFFIIDVIIDLPNENERKISELQTGVRKLESDIDEIEDFYSYKGRNF